MGYGRALLQRDVRKEEASLQKKATKKSLWGGIGRTLGGLGAMALTGGVVNPWTVGAITGGLSFLGGAIGAKASGTGDLSKQGKFFRSDRESIQKELGAFGTQNIVSSLKAGVTAGIMKKYDIMKGEKAIGKDLVTRGEESLATGRGVVGRRGYMAPGEITSQVEKGIAGDIRSKYTDVIRGEAGMSQGADVIMDQGLTVPSENVPFQRGDFADPSVFRRGVGDKSAEIIPISEATPRSLSYGDRTVTDTYGSREGGEYFFEDTPKVSAWDKFKDFVDVSDVVEERDLMSQIESVQGSSLSQYGPHSEFTARNQGWTPPGMGYKKPFSVLSKEFPGRRKSGLSNVIR